MQCTFGIDEWEPIDSSTLRMQREMATRGMIRYQSLSDGATVTVLDMTYKLIRMNFKPNSVVGVGDGMFYCDSEEVTKTKVQDAPPEYTTPSTIGIPE